MLRARGLRLRRLAHARAHARGRLHPADRQGAERMRMLAFLRKTFLENLREWKILILALTFAPFFVYVMYALLQRDGARLPAAGDQRRRGGGGRAGARRRGRAACCLAGGHARGWPAGVLGDRGRRRRGGRDPAEESGCRPAGGDSPRLLPAPRRLPGPEDHGGRAAGEPRRRGKRSRPDGHGDVRLHRLRVRGHGDPDGVAARTGRPSGRRPDALSTSSTSTCRPCSSSP